MEPTYAELGRLDPRGNRKCSAALEPGDVARRSPHVIRAVAADGSGRNGHIVGGGERNERAAIDGDEALRAVAPGPVR